MRHKSRQRYVVKFKLLWLTKNVSSVQQGGARLCPSPCCLLASVFMPLARWEACTDLVLAVESSERSTEASYDF